MAVNYICLMDGSKKVTDPAGVTREFELPPNAELGKFSKSPLIGFFVKDVNVGAFGTHKHVTLGVEINDRRIGTYKFWPNEEDTERTIWEFNRSVLRAGQTNTIHFEIHSGVGTVRISDAVI